MSWVFHVETETGQPIAGAVIQAEGPGLLPWAGTTNLCGDFIPPGPITPGTYISVINALGYKPRTQTWVLGGYGVIRSALERGSGPNGPPQRLVVRGDRFQRQDGTRITIIEHTDFRLFQRFINKEDVTPILRQRSDLGVNTLRVLGMCGNMFQLRPQIYGESYYRMLREFLKLCELYGFYVEFVVFADATVVMPDATDQIMHWEAVEEALQGIANVLVEAVNEEDQPINRVEAIFDLHPFPGILCAHGSNGSEKPPVRSWWDYETFHVNGAFEWWRKTGHNAMEFSQGDAEGNIIPSHKPVLTNEQTRVTDQESNAHHVQDAAAGAAGLCAGSCVHTVSGKDSVLLTAAEAAMVAAHSLGARSFNMDYQDGRYEHRADMEGPNDLRVYTKTIGDTVEVIRIRKE